MTIPAGAVHESRVEEAGVVMDHEVTPPGRHRRLARAAGVDPATWE